MEIDYLIGKRFPVGWVEWCGAKAIDSDVGFRFKNNVQWFIDSETQQMVMHSIEVPQPNLQNAPIIFSNFIQRGTEGDFRIGSFETANGVRRVANK